MKVLLVSDLHYRLPQFDWLVKHASNYDLVVIAGDSLDISSPVALDTQSVVMLRYLELLHKTTNVVISSGNHDLTGPDLNGEQAALWLAEAKQVGVKTDGDNLIVEDTLISICPWWDGPLGKEELEKQFEKDARKRTGKWLWIYHWPPLDSPTCWTGRRSYGDADLGEWIRAHKPDFVLSGHVHQPAFRPDGHWCDRIGSTWVFNPGTQIGPVPSYIEIDLKSGEASWTSMMGQETLLLSDAAAPARSVF